jgi:hypothetical protein
MIRRGCARGRTRGNIAGEHVAHFRQTDHFFAKGIERLKPLPGRNPAPATKRRVKLMFTVKMFDLGGQIVNRANSSTVLQAIIRSGWPTL